MVMGPLCGLRRVFPALDPAYTESEFWVDLRDGCAWYGDHSVELADLEIVILASLVSARGAFVPFEHLASAVWGEGQDSEQATVVLKSLRLLIRRFTEAGFPEDLFELKTRSGARWNTQAGR
jgi:DNA-binding response OmpR family regulator